jgi:hypothetical protein
MVWADGGSAGRWSVADSALSAVDVVRIRSRRVDQDRERHDHDGEHRAVVTSTTATMNLGRRPLLSTPTGPLGSTRLD